MNHPHRASILFALPVVACGLIAATGARAQTTGPAPTQPPAQAAPSPQQFQQSPAWANLPKMQLERQFAGPLQDTIVQRWRDPIDGAICYIYLPISAPVTPPNVTGFQQYGANVIGSISCMPGTGKSVAPTPAVKR